VVHAAPRPATALPPDPRRRARQSGDACFHLPVHPRQRRFLQFIWRGRPCRHTCLPFGLSTSPRTFTRITKPAVLCLRSQGVRVFLYLEDILVLANFTKRAQEHRGKPMDPLQRLGFSLDWEKSTLTPSQCFSYLVLQRNTRDLSVALPRDNTEEIRNTARGPLTQPVISARHLVSFLGKATFASYALPLARLHHRELQRALRTVCRRPTDLCKLIRLGTEARHTLALWERPTSTWRPLRQPASQITMATDASGTCREASLHSLSASGQWSAQQKMQHGSSLEMAAVWNASPAFRRLLRRKDVCVGIDNSTRVWHLSKEGGTHSPTLSRLACGILLWCQHPNTSPLPVDIKGVGNPWADSLSRRKAREWYLSPGTARRISKEYGTPDLDLCASRATKQLPRYRTLDSWDHRAHSVEALNPPWDLPFLHAFPPPRLTPTVSGDQTAGIPTRNAAESPLLEDAPWLPVILELLHHLPRRLLPSPNLLTQAAAGFPVGSLDHLRLAVGP